MLKDILWLLGKTYIIYRLPSRLYIRYMYIKLDARYESVVNINPIEFIQDLQLLYLRTMGFLNIRFFCLQRFLIINMSS